MGPREDLESNIRQSVRLMHEYDDIIRLSSDPKERERARHTRDEQTPVLKEQLTRYGKLCQVMQYVVPQDIDETAKLQNIDLYQPVTPEARQEVLTAISPQERWALLPTDTIPEPTDLPTGSRMPYCRNPLFVGRDPDLCRLAEALKHGHVVALTGPEGLGKTQLAVEFVHRYGQFFAGGVFWFSLTHASAMLFEMAACGGAMFLDLPGFAGLLFDEQVQRVQRAWEREIPRLLIFDNCEDEALLTAWTPTIGGCRVLLISRRATWDTSWSMQSIPLDVFTREESMALLRHALPDAPCAIPDTLDAIATEVGDLPLALHLAGSYLKAYQQTRTPADYLADLRSERIRTHLALHWEDQTAGPAPHHVPVARTFVLSYDQLTTDDPTDRLARALLARAACFAPDELLPHNVLNATVKRADDGNEVTIGADDALNRLGELGLLDTAECDAVRLHRLLARVVRAMAQDEQAQTDAEAVITMTAYELNSRPSPPFMLALQPLHMVVYTYLWYITHAAYHREDGQVAALAGNLGYHLHMIAQYQEAHPYCERAVAICERALDPMHPFTAVCLNNLARVHLAQGNDAAARPLLERTLAIEEQVYGPDHPELLPTLTTLAALLRSMHEDETACRLLERAIALNEHMPDSPFYELAEHLNDLGELYAQHGKTAAAHPCFERALAICERERGPLSPLTAICLHNLALLHADQGDYATARPRFEEALTRFERLYRGGHWRTETCRDNLARVIDKMEGQAQGENPQ